MPGAEHFRDSEILIGMLKKQRELGKWYAAICAAPVVALQPNGLLEGRLATCHPGRRADLINDKAAEKRVVVDGNLVTSQGPGTAMEFALKLVELLYDKQKAESVAAPMVM